METKFSAVVIEDGPGQDRAALKTLGRSALPEGDVTVRVHYSTLNYKDALAITGRAPIARSFPMVPGIDLVGVVEDSASPTYKPGDAVLLNGWGVGERHWGGLSQLARVNADWLVPLPSKFSAREAMAIGTAGYTAMLCVMALERQGVTPEKGEIVVTGAAGGVGSFAVAILSKLGYKVVGVTGRMEEAQYITGLGASDVLERSSFKVPGRPLQRERWAGAVDVVGSDTLANICASTKYRGVVTACGLAGGMDFPASVAPFILRGVTLVGIDSVMCPREERIAAWERLALDLDIYKLPHIAEEIGLFDVISTASKLLDGKVRGRVIVNVNS